MTVQEWIETIRGDQVNTGYWPYKVYPAKDVDKYLNEIAELDVAKDAEIEHLKRCLQGLEEDEAKHGL